MRFDENGDVQSDNVNLQDKEHARLWAAESPGKRPWRGDFRAAFRDVLQGIKPLPTRILELGSGPGLLAKCLLEQLDISEYVLFDFSEPMMEMAREALGPRTDVTYCLGNFAAKNWEQRLEGPFDAIVSMQAVHEIRHKRHVPWLYSRAATLLRPGGRLVVCDYEPLESDDEFKRQLASTRREQECAMLWAGLEDFQVHMFAHQYYLLSAMKPLRNRT